MHFFSFFPQVFILLYGFSATFWLELLALESGDMLDDQTELVDCAT